MKASVCVLLLLLLLAVCRAQEAPPATAATAATHTYASRNSVARFNRQYAAAPTAGPHGSGVTSPGSNCEYRSLMTSLHDRISMLATLDEAERARLESIDNKITQFESSNLARLESLRVQQTDFVKQLESIELLQRMMKHELVAMKGEFDEPRILNDIANEFENESNATRVARQTTNGIDLSGPAAALPEVAPTATGTNGLGTETQTDTQKLDALIRLVTSTRLAVTYVERDLARVNQLTTNIQRRVGNLQRRHGQAQAYNGGATYLPPALPSTSPSQLVSSCATGVPTISGIVQLQLKPNAEPFYVLCEENVEGGGWTVIMKRFNGDLNFQRPWTEYKTGFGNLAGEFFIGLDKLYALTASAVHELLIELTDFKNDTRYAYYDLFAIGSEQESYALNLLGQYDGNAGDAFTYHAGSKFSTFDNDNDGCVTCNCAEGHTGAWWYNWCDQSNLMGKYYREGEMPAIYRGMYWQNFGGPSASLQAATLLIRPVENLETRR